MVLRTNVLYNDLVLTMAISVTKTNQLLSQVCNSFCCYFAISYRLAMMTELVTTEDKEVQATQTSRFNLPIVQSYTTPRIIVLYNSYIHYIIMINYCTVTNCKHLCGDRIIYIGL